jgi:two-component system sensor histidine kinase/response regulator
MDLKQFRLLKKSYEATRKIREMAVNIPIIAVTASATTGEYEKCINSGMTDFLTKPFKKADLLPVLDKWLNVNNDKSEDSFEEVVTLSSKVFDFDDAVNTFMGDKDIVLELLQAQIVKMESQLEELKSFNFSEDFEKVRQIGHSIKGSCRNLSMKNLGNCGEELEFGGRDSDLEKISRGFENYEKCLEELKKQTRTIV